MTSTQHNLLYKIAALQQFDGSYNLDSEFTSAIGVNLSMQVAECNNKHWNQKAWATTLALAFFMKKLNTLKDDWELIADKSKLWLLASYSNQLDDMFDTAMAKYIL